MAGPRPSLPSLGLCAAIIERLTFSGNIIETGTDSHRGAARVSASSHETTARGYLSRHARREIGRTLPANKTAVDGVCKGIPNRTPGQSAARPQRPAKAPSHMTCPVNVSLSGGYPDGRARCRGQEPAGPSQVTGISVGFPPVLPGPPEGDSPITVARVRIEIPSARAGTSAHVRSRFGLLQPPPGTGDPVPAPAAPAGPSRRHRARSDRLDAGRAVRKGTGVNDRNVLWILSRIVRFTAQCAHPRRAISATPPPLSRKTCPAFWLLDSGRRILNREGT